jgi:protein-S-isoprenylcysteine O-methyltransferase Ste14
MLLFASVVIYLLLAFGIRSMVFYRKTRINPFSINFSDDANGYIEKVFLLVVVTDVILVGIHAFSEAWYEHLLPFKNMENRLVHTSGWVLLVLSFALVWVAQSQMSTSWRIGIDRSTKINLVTIGLFKVSRNPIFLGVILAGMSLFLIIPNAFTLLTLFLLIFSINVQVRLEEKFLLDKFGDDYQAYLDKVRRWV